MKAPLTKLESRANASHVSAGTTIALALASNPADSSVSKLHEAGLEMDLRGNPVATVKAVSSDSGPTAATNSKNAESSVSLENRAVTREPADIGPRKLCATR